MRKLLCLMLTLALVFTFGAGSAFAAGSAGTGEAASATVMKIAGVSGTVKITTEKGKDITPSDGTKLLSGYTVKTAAASYCYISLDDAKAIKLGQSTKVKIEKSGKKIEINIKSGEVFFDVDKKLSGSESMNMKTSNLTTGIRGTSGDIKVQRQKSGGDSVYLVSSDTTTTIFNLYSGVTETKMSSARTATERVSAGSSLSVSGASKPAQLLGLGIENASNTSVIPQIGDGTAGTQVIIKGAAELNAFAARAILEQAAIKGGVSVGTALSAPTEQIVAAAGDSLTSLGIADTVKEQLTAQASDGQALDAQIASEEQQAVQQTEAAAQTIEGAKTDAGSGNVGGAASASVFDNVSVQAGGSIDAGRVTFEGGGVTVSDTPSGSSGGSSSSGGGNSGGTSQQEGWLRGYTGVYDGDEHDVLESAPREQKEQYSIWVFSASDSNDMEVYESLRAEYDAAVDSLAGEGYSSERAQQIVMEAIGQIETGRMNDDLMTRHEVTNVSDSGTYYYFAVKNDNYTDRHEGDFNVSITRAPLEVVWYVSGEGQDMPEVATPGASYVSTAAIFRQGPARPSFCTTIEGAYIEVHSDTVSGYGTEEVTFEPYGAFKNSGPAQTQTGYSLLVEGLRLSVPGQDNRPVVSQTDNFYYPGGSRYEYTLIDDSQGNTGGNTGSAGPSEVDGSFFSSQGPWNDRTEYDIAFVANGTQADPTSSDAPQIPVYDKYFKGDTVRSEAGCSIEDIVAVLANTTSYASVYIDTGDEVKPISADLNINANGFNRAVFISGAGFTAEGADAMALSVSDSNSSLYVKLGYYDEMGYAPVTELVGFDAFLIGQRTQLKNHGEITVGNTMMISGDVQNYGTINVSQYCSSNNSIAIYSGGTLEQYDDGMIWDKREIKLNSNSSLTGGFTTYRVDSGGTMKLWGGALRRTVTSDSAEPTDTTSKVALRARAIFSVPGTERISYDGNYCFAPINQSGETLEAVSEGIVLCTFTGGGTVLGARLDGDNRVFHDSANGDFPRGSFFVTGENSEFNSENRYVEITFPHPNGTFSPAN